MMDGVKVCDFPKDKTAVVPEPDNLGWVKNAMHIVEECRFKDYQFGVCVDGRGAVYLQAHYDEPDTLTGIVERQFTRRWFLSPKMTKSEIVATVFKCAVTSMEHRTREWFLYRQRAIYHPHYDVDQLYAICDARDKREV
jgi:hypothetical protein